MFKKRRYLSLFFIIATSLCIFSGISQAATYTLWSWGRNEWGQLGVGTTSAYIPTATQVKNSASTYLTSTNPWIVSTGYYFSLGLDPIAKQLYVWGRNDYSQFGPDYNGYTSSNLAMLTHVANVVGVSAGQAHVLATTQDNAGAISYVAWGTNTYGQLGRGTISTSEFEPAPIAFPAGTNIMQFSGGSNHNIALDGDGFIWSWGGNIYGELGRPTQEYFSALPDRVIDVNGLLLGDVTAISTSWALNIAIGNTTDLGNTVYAWGMNTYCGTGMDLGGNSVRNPVPVTGFPSGVTITAVSAGYGHALALGSDGRVYAWGLNMEGELGRGSTSPSYSCVPAPVKTSSRAYLSNIVAISAGYNHSIVKDSNNNIWAWGLNNEGQLGLGTVSAPKTYAVKTSISKAKNIDASGLNFNLISK